MSAIRLNRDQCRRVKVRDRADFSRESPQNGRTCLAGVLPRSIDAINSG
jgi:hypothetical protein